MKWNMPKEKLQKGHVLYEGMSKDGLIIRFWYNLGLNLIETAYPVISITEGGS